MALLSVNNSDNNSDLIDKATCGICHRQVSRYTCPSCNIPYCSLPCFRSNEHAQCSEVFYKQELESEIQTQPTASKEERKRMLEVLKRFEENNADEDVSVEGEEDEGDDLVERLNRINIDSASASDIWSILTSDEREAFLSKVQAASSSSLQELLRAELDASIVLPWWDAPDVPTEESGSQLSPKRKYGNRPAMEQIPDALLSRPAGPDAGPPLLYNICAVLIAYSYATRHLGVSPLSQSKDEDDIASARQLLRVLVPFVADKRSSILFGSMDDVVTDMWSRLVDSERADRASFVLFLRDAARLLAPQQMALIETSPSNKSNLDDALQSKCLFALSDLIVLFKSLGKEAKETSASLKLRFYAAHVATFPSKLLAVFSAEVGTRARSVEREENSVGPDFEVSTASAAGAASFPDVQEIVRQPLIREI